jgi:hypothetical protein
MPLRTSESGAFPVAIGVGDDNARAIGTDGEAGHAAAVPRLVLKWVSGSNPAVMSQRHDKLMFRPIHKVHKPAAGVLASSAPVAS